MLTIRSPKHESFERTGQSFKILKKLRKKTKSRSLLTRRSTEHESFESTGHSFKIKFFFKLKKIKVAEHPHN